MEEKLSFGSGILLLNLSVCFYVGKVKSKSPKKLPSPPKPKALNEVTSSPQRAFSPGR